MAAQGDPGGFNRNESMRRDGRRCRPYAFREHAKWAASSRQ
jgi:hypothetical protein